jgi:hypothetical protein
MPTALGGEQDRLHSDAQARRLGSSVETVKVGRPRSESEDKSVASDLFDR